MQLLSDVHGATAADREDIEALLADASLPLGGLEDALPAAVVVRRGGRLVGCAAVEVRGEAGLLRSVAVVPDLRGSGLGRQLVASAEALAAARGVRTLYLLTETAADWFPRLGYAVIARSLVPASVAESVEFREACPVSAVAMRKQLG